MSLVSRAIVQALHGYVSLPSPIQGTFERAQEGKSFTLSQFATTEDTTFTGLLEQGRLDVGSVCLRRATQLEPTTLAQLATLEGPLTIKGALVRLATGTSYVATARLLSAPPRTTERVGRTATVLLTFRQEDIAACRDAKPVAFGTQPVHLPLAPVPSYVAALLTGALPRAVVACANGVFVLARRQTSRLPAVAGALSLVQNALTADVVVRSGHPASNCLYRVARNAVLFAEHESEHHQARQLQAALGAQQEDAAVQPTLVGPNVLASSTLGLLDRQPQIALEHVQEAVRNCFPRGSASEEPLVDWQAPRTSLVYQVSIRPAAQPAAAEAPDMAPTLVNRQLRAGGTVGLSVFIDHATLRDLRPGEAFGSVEAQLKRIVLDAVQDPPAALLQADFDRATERMGQVIQAQVTQAGCFSAPVKVHIQVQASRAQGEAIRTSLGDETVVPLHSLDVKEPRMAFYLAILHLQGLSATFTPWKLAKRSGLLLS
jgi:hypothetical protein